VFLNAGKKKGKGKQLSVYVRNRRCSRLSILYSFCFRSSSLCSKTSNVCSRSSSVYFRSSSLCSRSSSLYSI